MGVEILDMFDRFHDLYFVMHFAEAACLHLVRIV